MKIVINSDYGGFGLSGEAMEFIASRKGWNYQIIDSYERWWEPPLNSIEYNIFGAQIWDVDLPRTDRDLVDCVELLGDRSWGRNAALKVVMVPDEVEWHIQEQDGREWIAEDHRTWM
ncbi:hypothetical protein EB118_13085 [bacterium]|nr:hypothetical protein [bacterium]